jgi:hypothetical protein
MGRYFLIPFREEGRSSRELLYITFKFASTTAILIISIVTHSNTMTYINIFHENKWRNGDYKTDEGYSKQLRAK